MNKEDSMMKQEERSVCYDKDLGVEAYHFKGIMQKFPNHFHEDYVIGFIESGRRHLSCRNKDYIVGTGDLLLFNPLDNHTCEQLDDKTLDYRCINIKPEIMKKAILEVTGSAYLPSFSQTVGLQSELVELLKELHIAIMEEQSDLKKEETFLFLIQQLMEDFTQPAYQHIQDYVKTEIQEVCGYIDKHYSEHITLEELSTFSCRNKYSLLRSFTKWVGITPYRYLETVRINEAKKLLVAGVGLMEAAICTGFTDQSHFSNYFKELTGLTPKQYQNIFTDMMGNTHSSRLLNLGTNDK
jgi:AraC-like DNA-binding protein